MTEPSRRHRLAGLEPDNLLALLVLLGLLRALQTARPRWHPRAAWDLDHPPLRPLLILSESGRGDGDLRSRRRGSDNACGRLQLSPKRRGRSGAPERPQLYERNGAQTPCARGE